MEFLLSLREALSQLDEPPQPYAVEMFPSVFLIPLEQEALKRIICSRCGACAWEKVRQAALPRRPDISWPYNLPAGDRLHCRCVSCGQKLDVVFWFTE